MSIVLHFFIVLVCHITCFSVHCSFFYLVFVPECSSTVTLHTMKIPMSRHALLTAQTLWLTGPVKRLLQPFARQTTALKAMLKFALAFCSAPPAQSLRHTCSRLAEVAAVPQGRQDRLMARAETADRVLILRHRRRRDDLLSVLACVIAQSFEAPGPPPLVFDEQQRKTGCRFV